MSRLKMKATEGMVLTNGEVFGRQIFLGTGDSPDNWHEIPEAEYEALMESSRPDEDRATDADYRTALREMGVKV